MKHSICACVEIKDGSEVLKYHESNIVIGKLQQHKQSLSCRHACHMHAVPCMW